MGSKHTIAGVSADTPLRDAVPRILRAKAEPLFALGARAGAGLDADAVHDMRVASRRLREVMRLFEDASGTRSFKVWYRRVRRVTRALGPVRDADVFIDALSGLLPSLDAEEGRAVAFLIGHRFGLREWASARLRDDLERAGLDGRRTSFERMAASAGAGDGSVPMRERAYASIAERMATVSEAQAAALDPAAIEAQHALRIAYKRLRYAVETFAPCYADAFGPVHATLTAFQDTLGELHDAHLFAESVRVSAGTTEWRAAGVTAEDLERVARRFDAMAEERFEAFRVLAGAHPDGALREALLTPLMVTTDV
jgi:CHAD domain-containing protein